MAYRVSWSAIGSPIPSLLHVPALHQSGPRWNCYGEGCTFQEGGVTVTFMFLLSFLFALFLSCSCVHWFSFLVSTCVNESSSLLLCYLVFISLQFRSVICPGLMLFAMLCVLKLIKNYLHIFILCAFLQSRPVMSLTPKLVWVLQWKKSDTNGLYKIWTCNHTVATLKCEVNKQETTETFIF